MEVAGFTEAPIPWPAYASITGARLTPILNGDLTRAVRTESAMAVAYWWGVSRATATRWRHALGVRFMNEGTLALWRTLTPKRLSKQARIKGARAPKPRRQRTT